MSIVIRKCVCNHQYQDNKYGKGNRVHNVGPDKLRCTVCAREIKMSMEEIKKIVPV